MQLLPGEIGDVRFTIPLRHMVRWYVGLREGQEDFVFIILGWLTVAQVVRRS
jgi:hypothetical protein